ncbi:hypothetical protein CAUPRSCDRAFT_12504 [Caulochytrium protostelioides]|uniref:Uncharacterized protein n=1 Tax=Caulochytrium protostelioides TaxID=1555241 RepID=A0A4P9WRQ1_9FUNG|nr:hypothetical protein CAUPRSCDRAFT_12504 [Caulochytrium protostelioides]
MADIYTSSHVRATAHFVSIPYYIESAGRDRAEAYSEHIQNLLADDRALWESHLPFSAENDLYAALTDGILLSHIMAKIKPGCLDLKTINHKVDRAQIGTKAGVKDTFEATANLNRCFDPALTKQLGVVTVK